MRPPRGYDPACEAPHAPLGRWVRWDGLHAGSPLVQLLWWVLFRAVEHDQFMRRWSAESIEEVGFVVHHHSCTRCGRQHISAHSYGEGRHYCGKPYFRPRGVLHPQGPTKGQAATAAAPRLVADVEVVERPRVAAPARQLVEVGEAAQTSLF